METKQQYREPMLEYIRFYETGVITESGVPWDDEWNDALDQLQV